MNLLLGRFSLNWFRFCGGVAYTLLLLNIPIKKNGRTLWSQAVAATIWAHHITGLCSPIPAVQKASYEWRGILNPSMSIKSIRVNLVAFWDNLFIDHVKVSDTIQVIIVTERTDKITIPTYSNPQTYFLLSKSWMLMGYVAIYYKIFLCRGKLVSNSWCLTCILWKYYWVIFKFC